MKKKISISEYTKNAAALRIIELDQQAAEVLGVFEKYYHTHNHAQKIAETIMEAAGAGETKCIFTITKLEEWGEYPELSLEKYHPPILSEAEFKNTIILKTVARQLGRPSVTMWSYGTFLLEKVKEIIPTLECVAFKSGNILTLDWSEEVLKVQRREKLKKVLGPVGLVVTFLIALYGFFAPVPPAQFICLIGGVLGMAFCAALIQEAYSKGTLRY